MRLSQFAPARISNILINLHFQKLTFNLHSVFLQHNSNEDFVFFFRQSTYSDAKIYNNFQKQLKWFHVNYPHICITKFSISKRQISNVINFNNQKIIQFH